MKTSATYYDKRMQGCCGPSSSTTTSQSDGWRVIRRSQRRRSRAKRQQTRSGAISSATMCFPCRINGSTPGSRHGIPRSIWFQWRRSTRGMQRISCCSCCGSGTYTRMGRCRRMSLPLATSIRQCTRGPSCMCTRCRQGEMAASRMSTSLSAHFKSYC